jgi:hypothetical protein
MKLLSSMVFAGAVALTVVPALASSVIVSGSIANSGFVQTNFGFHNTVKTGKAVAFSDTSVIGSTQGSSPVVVSAAVANTGVVQVNGGMNNSVTTGSAVAGSSVTVVNFKSSFKR